MAFRELDTPELHVGSEVVVMYQAGPRKGCGQGGTLTGVTPQHVHLTSEVYGLEIYERALVRVYRDAPLDEEECLEYRTEGEDCSGPVEYRHPLSGTGRSYPRCDRHWQDRLAFEEGLRKRYPEQPPRDWSPLDAGESWDED